MLSPFFLFILKADKSDLDDRRIKSCDFFRLCRCVFQKIKYVFSAATKRLALLLFFMAEDDLLVSFDHT